MKEQSSEGPVPPRSRIGAPCSGWSPDVDVTVNEQAAERQFEEKEAQFLAAAASDEPARRQVDDAPRRALAGEAKDETEEAIADLEEKREQVKDRSTGPGSTLAVKGEKFEDGPRATTSSARTSLLERMKTNDDDRRMLFRRR